MFSKIKNRTGISFSLKQTALYALFFIISSTGLFIIAYFLIDNIIEQRERDIINIRLREYRAWYNEGGLFALKARFDEQSEYTRDIYFIRVLGRYDNAMFIHVPGYSDSFDPSILNQINPYLINTWFTVNDKDNKSTWTVISIPLRRSTILQVGKRSTRSYELLKHFRSIFLLFTIPILFIGITVGGFLTYSSMIPIRRIIQTVQKIIDTGQLNEQVPERKERGELDKLVKLFNLMLRRNESLIRAMKDSLDNVAHDLKTPMTRMRGIAEQALKNPDNHQACLEALSDSLEESERVVSMLNTLMDVSEAEAGTMNLDLKAVSMTGIIQSVVDLYEISADEKQIKIILDLPEQLEIRADHVRVQQIISNLLDNAIKYSPSHTEISIELSESDSHVVISVIDGGIGIPESEIDKIWDRLYRGDHSRSKKGVGLGLSFVKAITNAHGGHVQVKSSVGQGSKFSINLPKS